MTIEVSLLLAGLSLAFGVYQGLTNMRRARAKDIEEAANAAKSRTQLDSEILLKLGNISDGIKDIKKEMADMKNEQRETRDRLIETESSLKQLWHRFKEKNGIERVIKDE
jgi:hypothetical protein